MSSSSRKSKSDQEREKIIQNRLQELLKRMLQDEDNKYCVDCDSKGPRWASWNLGIFVCIRCAGIHRNLGVHISKVKSVNLDTWTPTQVASMQIMGNSKARAVYEANVPEDFRRPQTDAQLDVFIRTKYEKKKYIAREWVPGKAPEFPEGWTALIEAEKQKKDIRSIVLPSHTNNDDDIVKRERQSPKEKAKAKPAENSSPKTPTTIATTTTTTPKKSALESDFDLLSLNTSSSNSIITEQPVVKPVASSNSDLLFCLGGDNNATEFDDFVGAPPKLAAVSNPPSQNGTPKNSSSTNCNFFGDFTTLDNNVTAQSKQQAMSKDSIMALFNQKPVQPNPLLVQQQQQQFGGLLGNLGPQQQQPQAFPQQPQFPINMGNNLAASSTLNNPFLAMAQQPATTVPVVASDPNNLFGNVFGGGQNRNFFQ